MKNRHSLVYIAFGLVVAGGVLWFFVGKRAVPTGGKGIVRAGEMAHGRNPVLAERGAPPPMKENFASAPPKSLGRDAILGEIEDASVTYDPIALPRIEPYLRHGDPEIREAARNGMIVLGDAAAGPLLRKASDDAATPQEAVAFIEAADYVELPSGTLILRERLKVAKPSQGRAPAVPGRQRKAPLVPESGSEAK